VLVDLAERRPIAIPAEVREAVRAFEGADLEE
jgi:acyl-CoA thioesterase FadM